MKSRIRWIRRIWAELLSVIMIVVSLTAVSPLPAPAAELPDVFGSSEERTPASDNPAELPVPEPSADLFPVFESSAEPLPSFETSAELPSVSGYSEKTDVVSELPEEASAPVLRGDRAGTKLDGTVSFHYASLLRQGRDAFYSGLSYDDAWFFKDSLSYNHALATMSLGLAMSGFKSTSGPPDQNVRALFSDLGFDMESFRSFRFDQDDSSSVALALCLKELPPEEDSGNTGSTLLAIVPRSISYGKTGWQDNLTVGSSGDSPYHVGFYRAASYAADRVWEYLAAHPEVRRDSLKVWLVGYSRAAPIAGILSGLLTTGRLSLNREQIYAYDFATANYVRKGSREETLGNSFHILGARDLIALLPPYGWGLVRSGREKVLPGIVSGNAPGEWTDPVMEQYRNLVEQGFAGSASPARKYDIQSFQRPLLNWLQYRMETVLPSRDQYASSLQETILSVFTGNISLLTALAVGSVDVEGLLNELSQLKVCFDNHDAEGMLSNITSARPKVQKLQSIVGSYYGKTSTLCLVLGFFDELLEGAEREAQKGFVSPETGAACTNLGVDANMPNSMALATLYVAVQDKVPERIMNEHYAETILAWMTAIEEEDLRDESAFASKVILIHGSADAAAFDSQGEEIASIRGNKTLVKENPIVTCAYLGSLDKVFVTEAGQDCELQIEGTSGGTLTYMVFENLADNVTARKITYPSLSVRRGQVITASVNGIPDAEPEDCALYTEGKTILPYSGKNSHGPSGMTLNHTDLTLDLGDAVQLTAQNVPGGQTVHFESTDPAVASVDESGLVKGLALGKTTIVCRTEDGLHRASCAVSVVKPTYSGIGTSTVMVKGKIDISKLMPAPSGKIRYISDRKKTASVTRKGIVRGRRAGEVKILLQQKMENVWVTIDSCTLRVEKPVMEARKTLEGGVGTFSAYELLSGTEYAPTLWRSTNPAVATVTADGTVTIHGKGKTKLIAEFGLGKYSTGKKYKTLIRVK